MSIIDISYVHDSATGQTLLDANGLPMLDTTSGANDNANTSAQLVSRIQNEVLGSPQTTDIQNSILDAIHMFDGETFWFNSFRLFGGTTGSLTDLQATLGKEFYSNGDLPSLIHFPHISKALVLAFNNRYPLINRTQQWIDDQSVSPIWRGMPTDWAIQGGDLRIFPIPDAAEYTFILNATVRFPDPAFGSDFSPWTNRAERLIRSCAKMLLFRDIIRDEAQAVVFEKEVYGDPQVPWKIGEYRRLKSESFRRSGGPGKIRASRGYM